MPVEGLGGVDKALLAPVAHGYMAVAPKPLRERVGNVVYNLGEPNTVMNEVLQGKPKMAMRTTTRFIVNSAVGVLGLFDVGRERLESIQATSNQDHGIATGRKEPSVPAADAGRGPGHQCPGANLFTCAIHASII